MADTVESTIYELILQDNASAPLKKFLELFGSRPKQIEALGIALVKIQGAMDATGKTAATLSDILPHLTQNFQEIAAQVGAPVVSARQLATALRAVGRASADVTDATKGTAQSVAEVGQQAAGAAKSLETAAQASDRFKGAANFKGAEASVTLLGVKAAQVAPVMGKAAAATQQNATATAQAARAAQQFTGASSTLGGALGRIQAQSAAAAKGMAATAAAIGQVGAGTNIGSAATQVTTLAGAAKNLATQMGAAEEANKKTGESALGMAAGIAFATFAINRATHALGSFVSEAVSEFGGLQKGLATVNSLADFSANKLGQVTRAVQELATVVPQTTAELSKGLFDVVSTIGAKGDETLKVLTLIAKAATAGQTDTSTVTRAALGQINAFGLGMGQLNNVLDAHFVAVDRGTGTYEELSNAIGLSTGAAVAANQTYQEQLAVITLLTRKGLNFAQASTATGKAFESLLAHRADFKRLTGVDIVDKATGQLRGLIEVLTDVGKSISKFDQLTQTDIIRKLFPNERAFKAAILLFRDLGQSSEILSDVTTRTGAFGAAFGRATANVSDQAKLLGNSIKNAFSDIGESVAPGLLTLIGAAKGLAQAFRDTPTGFKQFVGGAAALLTAAGAVTVGLLSLGGALRGFKFLFADAATGAFGFATALRGLGLATIGPAIGAFLISPLGLVTAALVAGGVAWLAYRTHVHAAAREQAQISQTFRENVDSAQPIIRTLVELGAVQNRTTDQNRLLDDAFKKLKTGFPGLVAGINSTSDALAHQNEILGNNIARLNEKAELERKDRAKAGQEAGRSLGDLQRQQKDLAVQLAETERRQALRVAKKTTEFGFQLPGEEGNAFGRIATGREARSLHAQGAVGVETQVPLPPLSELDALQQRLIGQKADIDRRIKDLSISARQAGVIGPRFEQGRGGGTVAQFATVGGTLGIDERFSKVLEKAGLLGRAEHGGRDIFVAVSSAFDRMRFGAPGSRVGGPIVPFTKDAAAVVLDLFKRAGIPSATAKGGQIVAQFSTPPEPKGGRAGLPGIGSRIETDELQKQIDLLQQKIELTKATGDAAAAGDLALSRRPELSLKEAAALKLKSDLEENATAQSLIRLNLEKSILEANHKQIQEKQKFTDETTRAKKALEKDPTLGEDPEAKRIVDHSRSAKEQAVFIANLRATATQSIAAEEAKRRGLLNDSAKQEIERNADVARKKIQHAIETASILDKIEIDRLKATGQKAAALQLEAQSEGRKRLLELAQNSALTPAQQGAAFGAVSETLSADFLKNQIAVHQEERNAAQRLAAETRQEFENNARDVIEFGEFTRAEQLGIITVAIAGLRQQGLVSRQLLREQKQLLRDGVDESRKAADEVSRHILDLAEQNTRVAGLGERGIIAVREALSKDERLTDEDRFSNFKALEEARRKFVQDNEKEILDTRRANAEAALKSAEEQQRAFLDSVAQQRESLKAPIVSFLTGPASAKSLIQAFSDIGGQASKVLKEKLTEKLFGRTLDKSAEALTLAAGVKQVSAAEVQLRAAEVQALAADKQLGLKEIQDVRLAPQVAAATQDLKAVTGRTAEGTITISAFSPPDKDVSARIAAGEFQAGLNGILARILESQDRFTGSVPFGGGVLPPPQAGREESFQDRINALRGVVNPEVIAQANADLIAFSVNLKAVVTELTALSPLFRRAVEKEPLTGKLGASEQRLEKFLLPQSGVPGATRPTVGGLVALEGVKFNKPAQNRFDPEFARLLLLLKDQVKRQLGVDIGVFSGTRTAAEQRAAAAGNPFAAPVGQSPHQFGRAADILPVVGGQFQGIAGQEDLLRKVQDIAQQLGLSVIRGIHQELNHIGLPSGRATAATGVAVRARVGDEKPAFIPEVEAARGAFSPAPPALPTATVPQEIGVAFTLDAHAKEKFNAAVAPLQDFRATVQGSVGLLLSVLPALAPGFEVEIDRLLAPLREPIHIRREVFPEFVLPEVKPLSVPQPVEIAFSIIGDTSAAILAAIRPLQSLHPHQEAQVDLGLSVVPQLLAGFQERVAGLLAPLQAPLTLFRDVDQILRVSQKQELSGANGLPALDAPGRVAEALSVRQPVDVTFDLDPRVGEKFAAALVPVRSLAPNLTEVVDVLLDIQPRLEERFAEEISRTLLPLTVAEHLVKNVDQRVVVAVSEEINFPDQQRERERILAGLTSPTPLTVTQAVGLDFTLEPNFDQEFQRAIAPAADLHAALTGLASIEVQTAPFLAGDAGRKLEAVLAPLQSPLRVIKDVVQELRVAVVESGSFQAQREQFLAAINAPVPPIITAIANMLSVTVAGDPSFASKMQAETAPLQAPLDLSRLVGMRLIVNPEPDAALPERLASLLRELAKPLEQVVTPVTNLLEVTPLMRTATGQDVSSLLDGLKVPLTVNRDVQVRPNVREALTAGETRFKPIPEFGPKPEIPAAATTPFVVPKGGFAKIDFPPDLERAVGRQFPAEEISNIISQFAAINKARPLTPIGGAGGPEGALRGQFGLDKRGLGTFDERVGGFLFPKTAPDGSNVVTFADNKINENLFGKVVGSPALAAILDKARAKDERAKATKDTQPEPHFTNLAKFGQLLNSFQSGQGSQGILGQGLSAITSFGAGSQISPAFGWLSAGLSLLGGLFGKKKKTPQPQDPFPALPSVDATNFASIRRIQGSGEAGREGGPIPLAGKQQITLTTTAQVSFAEIHIHSGDARSAGREFLGGISEAGARSLAGQLAGSKV